MKFILLLVALIVVGTSIGIVLYLQKKDNLDWTSDQQLELTNILSGNIPSDLIDCMKKELMHLSTYEEFKKDQEKTLKMLLSTTKCLGVKGKWNESFKKMIFTEIFNNPNRSKITILTDEAIHYLVDNLESTYSPNEFLNIQKSDMEQVFMLMLLGKKGKWSDYMKNILRENLQKMIKDENIVNCIINKVELSYDPSDKNIDEDMQSIIQKCSGH